jgi:hypothetical protein
MRHGIYALTRDVPNPAYSKRSRKDPTRAAVFRAGQRFELKPETSDAPGWLHFVSGAWYWGAYSLPFGAGHAAGNAVLPHLAPEDDLGAVLLSSQLQGFCGGCPDPAHLLARAIDAGLLSLDAVRRLAWELRLLRPDAYDSLCKRHGLRS